MMLWWRRRRDLPFPTEGDSALCPVPDTGRATPPSDVFNARRRGSRPEFRREKVQAPPVPIDNLIVSPSLPTTEGRRDYTV